MPAPLLMLGLLACAQPPPEEPWTAQLQAGGPCYEANLLDGLSQESTDELKQVYACVNRTGLLTPLGGLVAAMDAPGRAGDPAGIELARALAAALEAELDVFGLFGRALDLLEAEGAPARTLALISVELLYGTSAERVASGDINLLAGSSLDAGALRPLLPGLRDAATATLDGELRAARRLGEALGSDAARSALHTAAAMAATPATRALLDDLALNLGQAIEASRDPGNDRWSEASGDALRDLADKLLVETGNDGRPAIEHLADPLRLMLADEALRRRVEGALLRLEAEGRLDNLPLQALHLAEVDARGGALSTGEDSALLTLLRLLHEGNEPMVCTLDVFVTELEVDLGNLSVALLEELSRQDPATVIVGVDLLGEVIGWGLSQSVLDAVADSGLCPVLDRQMAADLQALDRLNDPQVGDLLVSGLALLEAIEGPGTSRMPELVDVLDTVYGFGAVPPVEELLRDLADAALVRDLIDLVGVLLEPADHLDLSGLPQGVAPLDFDGLWGVVQAAFTPGEAGLTPVEQLAPLLQVVVLREESWQALGNLGALLRRPDARIADPGPLLVALAEVDPDGQALAALAPLLQDERVIAPALRLAETHEVVEALGEAELSAEGPLPFYARLVVSGTLDAALAWVDWTLSLLRSP